MYWRTLKILAKRPATSQLESWVCQKSYSSQNTHARTVGKSSKPLRILFCGSDEFSSASLRAVYDEQRRDPNLIASIDVMCRPGKPSGRSLKTIREVPIKAVAEELGLPVHTRDTFTGWDSPKPQGQSINLIIAVSFGLFVPPRILRSAEYGGLNVHPSILPNFRGPAPLQYTIMTGAHHCGVTLQTLDEKSFDHGTILAHTQHLPIPLGKHCKYPDLLSFITPIAASLLVDGLRSRVFVPPLINKGGLVATTTTEQTGGVNIRKIITAPLHAPKITSADKRINWKDESVIPIERRHRALGRLWTEVLFDPETKKRIFFEDMELVDMPEAITSLMAKRKETETGLVEGSEERTTVRFLAISPKTAKENPRPRFFVSDGDAIIVACKGGAFRAKYITVEGKGRQHASRAFGGVEEWEQWDIRSDKFKLFLTPKRAQVDEGLGLAQKVGA
ncbi:Methionyl-tRNA [Hyphodiscus hymeniophilus]|uniref:methionyl-tRNA formyltransferase n=1 Tax=Hyphodiscus hymeniophilus TaxID=353542 RepID=A0A9P6SLE3_9HELO|nr:Methionyl-tRNA [Hyphodiscus hymeniophilus]